ncbi:MAG: segregation/condensation protein A [Rhodocyclaceae bacterium]|nr:segregation/condensation protein A [Rhodocyclaceae bacterium]
MVSDDAQREGAYVLESNGAEPVARLYGEPLADLPRDLYIPPDALRVFLEAFEGPLDLLLYLIRKANLNILDIPMAKLTAQYLDYVEAMRRHNLELAADYLLMAAMLLEIKSRMLLPRPSRTEGEQVEDPRAELVRRLKEYEQIKLAAQRLDALPQAGRDFEVATVWLAAKTATRLPEVRVHELALVWLALVKRARLRQHHRVEREELSVREQMGVILRRLAGGDFVTFEALFDAGLGPPGLIVSFLAVLELARESLIEIIQVEALAPIYIRLRQDVGDIGGSEGQA